MAIEIEKPEVTFTDEAKDAIQRTMLRVERGIRARAADHAIKSRGTPAEVTGSDIEKAYRELSAGPSTGLLEDKEHDHRYWRYWQSRRKLQFLSTIYSLFGLLIALCAGVYPFIRTQLTNPTVKVSAVVALTGLFISAVGLTLSVYLRQRERDRMEEEIRRYSSSPRNS